MAQRGTWIGGTLLALAFAMGGSAVAAPGAADASSLVAKAPEKVRDYWTAARIRAAIPAPAPSRSAP